MATRWWHHDDRMEPTPSRVSNDASSAYRQASPQQQCDSATAQLHAGAGHQSQGHAPGFTRTGNAALAKAPLPKAWEYEDPLKDVHGPFDAAQIINWFAQDWFGTDLKIRRVGQYWTQLEYVLEELKAEARGTAILPSGGYMTAPQQLPQAATTPATSFSPHRLVAGSAASAAGSSYSRLGNAVMATDCVSDSWDAAAGIPSSSRVRGRGTATTAAAPTAQGSASLSRDAADHLMYLSGDGHGPPERGAPMEGRGSGRYENASGSRVARGGREREPIEARDRCAATAGVQFGSDGKWERGHVIGGDSRRGQRGGRSISTGYQDPYGDEYGNREPRGDYYGSRELRGDDYGIRRERRGRGAGRGGSRGSGDVAAVDGYERAIQILEGDDDEYGAAARPVRARGTSNAPAQDTSSAWGASIAATADRGRTTEKHSRSSRESASRHRAMQSGDTTLPTDAVAAAVKPVADITVAAATDGWGSSTVSAHDGWGPSSSTGPNGCASDDGWGSNAAPTDERWGDSEAYLTADVRGTQQAVQEVPSPAAALQNRNTGAGTPVSGTIPCADSADDATAQVQPGRAAHESQLACNKTDMSEPWPLTEADSAGSAAGTSAEASALLAATPTEPAAIGELERAASKPSSHSSPRRDSTPQRTAHQQTNAHEERPSNARQANAPPVKLSGVKALIAQQEEQLRQAAAAAAPAATTPPLSPMRKVSSLDCLSPGTSAGKGGYTSSVASPADASPADAARAARSSPTASAEEQKAAAGETTLAPTADSNMVATITAAMFSRVVGAFTGEGSSSPVSKSASTSSDKPTQGTDGPTDAVRS